MSAIPTQFINLGLIKYQEAWDYQEKLFGELMDSKKEGETPARNYLIFCQHPHVYTLGKSGKEQNLLINALQLQDHDAQFVKTNRGGDITYHGPGQLVGYPIFDLEQFNIGIKEYIYKLEQAIIETLKDLYIKSERLEKASGVWLDTHIPQKTRKICSIGVRSSRWITMHGFAFNINTDLNYFSYINPCGFTDKKMTSVSNELGKTETDFDKLSSLLKDKLQLSFDLAFV